AAPAMRPLHQTRATTEVLIEIAGKLKRPVALPWKSFDEMLKASMPEAAWTAAQKQGWAIGNGGQAAPTRDRQRDSMKAVTYDEAKCEGEPGALPVGLTPY